MYRHLEFIACRRRRPFFRDELSLDRVPTSGCSPPAVTVLDSSILSNKAASLAEDFPTFRKNHCLHLQGQAVEGFMLNCPKTRRQLPEDLKIQKEETEHCFVRMFPGLARLSF
jgi:hypothetical protein